MECMYIRGKGLGCIHMSMAWYANSVFHCNLTIYDMYDSRLEWAVMRFVLVLLLYCTEYTILYYITIKL